MASCSGWGTPAPVQRVVNADAVPAASCARDSVDDMEGRVDVCKKQVKIEEGEMPPA